MKIRIETNSGETISIEAAQHIRLILDDYSPTGTLSSENLPSSQELESYDDGDLGLEGLGDTEAQASDEENLRNIRGIGPRRLAILRNLGIDSYRELAYADAQALEPHFDAATTLNMIQRWQEQALELIASENILNTSVITLDSE